MSEGDVDDVRAFVSLYVFCLGLDDAGDDFSLSTDDMSEGEIDDVSASDDLSDFSLGLDDAGDDFSLSTVDMSEGEVDGFDLGLLSPSIDDVSVDNVSKSSLDEDIRADEDIDMLSLNDADEQNSDTPDFNLGDLGFDMGDFGELSSSEETNEHDDKLDDVGILHTNTHDDQGSEGIDNMLSFLGNELTEETSDVTSNVSSLDSDLTFDDFDFEADALSRSDNLETDTSLSFGEMSESEEKDFDLGVLALGEGEDLGKGKATSDIGEDELTEEAENEEIYNLLDTLSGGYLEQEAFGKARDESEKMSQSVDLPSLGLDALSTESSFDNADGVQSKEDNFSLTQELDDLLHSFDSGVTGENNVLNYDKMLSDSSLHLDSARSYLAQADFEEAKNSFSLAVDDPETREDALQGLAEIARLEGNAPKEDALLSDLNPVQAAEDHAAALQMKVDLILTEAGEGETLESLADTATAAGDYVKASEYNFLAEDLMRALQAVEDTKNS